MLEWNIFVFPSKLRVFRKKQSFLTLSRKTSIQAINNKNDIGYYK